MSDIVGIEHVHEVVPNELQAPRNRPTASFMRFGGDLDAAEPPLQFRTQVLDPGVRRIR